MNNIEIAPKKFGVNWSRTPEGVILKAGFTDGELGLIIVVNEQSLQVIIDNFQNVLEEVRSAIEED